MIPLKIAQPVLMPLATLLLNLSFNKFITWRNYRLRVTHQSTAQHLLHTAPHQDGVDIHGSSLLHHLPHNQELENMTKKDPGSFQKI
jgi:hypothetical protein